MLAEAATASASSPPPAHPDVPGVIEADDPVNEAGVVGDGDSAVGTALGSDTTSLMSSILKYRQENGRTYHAYKDGTYLLPNDEQEKDRLGTGIWAIDFADEHPEAKVIGVDLSPIQPSYVPPNVSFFVDDLEDEWTFTDRFDFIFSRFMTGSIANWPKFFKNCFNYLNPGGVLEVQDFVYPLACDDGSVTKDSAFYRWSVMVVEAFERMKRPITSALHYKEQLEAAGFTDIVVKQYKWPINRWPRDPKYKELGTWVYENVQLSLSALIAVFTRPKEEGGLRWSAEELESLLVDVRKEAKNTALHGYCPIYIYYAKKPESKAE